MQTSAVPFRKGTNKPAFDPLQKRGLLPSSGSELAPQDAGATYIVGGYVLDTTTKHDPSDRYISEHMGREKEARRKRQIEGKEADKRLLEHLMGQETSLTTGAQALRMAQKQLVAGKNKTGERDEGVVKEKTKKSAFSASALQRIGFDPTVKGGVEKKPKQEAQPKVSISGSHEHEFWLTNGQLEALSKAGGSSTVHLGKPPKKPNNANIQLNKDQEEVTKSVDSDSDLEIV